MALTVNPDIRSRALGPNTQFAVIACDGIWDCMSSKQCCDFVTMAKNKQRELIENGGSSLLRQMESPLKSSNKFGASAAKGKNFNQFQSPMKA